jgi:DNA-binding NtrC family response regulator
VRQLTGLGYRVFEAKNAKEALPILASEDRLDLLFTDVVMPGDMDGIGLAHYARQMLPNLGILLASGFPTIKASAQRTNSSEFPLLGKPYRSHELARAVREVLDGLDRGTSCRTRGRADIRCASLMIAEEIF